MQEAGAENAVGDTVQSVAAAKIVAVIGCMACLQVCQPNAAFSRMAENVRWTLLGRQRVTILTRPSRKRLTGLPQRRQR